MKTGLARIKRQPPESRPPYRLRDAGSYLDFNFLI